MSAQTVAEIRLPGGRLFQAVEGDLLREPSDAIVNAANGHLAHGGGVAGVIARAAGHELEKESQAIVRQRGVIPTGEAVVTTAGKLPFQGVIHAVGPRLGDGDEGAKLVKALKACFRLAHERGWHSVSFPAVSAGIFAVPPEVCARAYVRAVREFFADHPETPLRTVRLALVKGAVLEEVRRVMAQ